MGSFTHKPRSRPVRFGPILNRLLSVLCLGGLFTCQGAEEQVLEHQVKAAFLLNFTKFVEWPQAAFTDERSPIAICVLGDGPFGGALDQIVEGEVVGGRKVIVRRIKEPPAPKQCQVLFLSPGIKDVAQILATAGPGVLSVGEERENFLQEGGVIAFVVENRHVRFDINESAAENAGLKLSSRLLRVARSVEK
jgi:uncharacterized protein DUF4154